MLVIVRVLDGERLNAMGVCHCCAFLCCFDLVLFLWGMAFCVRWGPGRFVWVVVVVLILFGLAGRGCSRMFVVIFDFFGRRLLVFSGWLGVFLCCGSRVFFLVRFC